MAKTELIVQNKQGKIYDVSQLCKEITFEEQLNDGCSKLQFTLIYDKNLQLENGNTLYFKYDGNKVFFGRVFIVNVNSSNEMSVTAYDQLRYLKAKDTIIVSNDTVSTLVKKGCNYFNLRITPNLTDTKYRLGKKIDDSMCWLDILYDSIDSTLMGCGELYCLRDNFGYIELVNLKSDILMLNTMLLLTEFDYEKSIDDEVYNQIKLARDNEETGKRDIFITKDSNSINNDWGLLQLFEVVDKGLTDAQVKAMADAYLKLYKNESETLSLTAIGDMRVRAGSSFWLELDNINYKKRVIVQSITHEFLPVHTMSIEVKV